MSTEALADALEKALRTEDSHLAVRRLTGLASGELDIISALHPDQIKVYVKVFCDVSVPAVRRRWIGLILCRLLDSDFDVMQGQTTPRANPIRFSQKIQKEPKPKTQFSQLGQILISGTELEETKIIAGLIIRQELRKGVDYDTLWSSDEVPSAAPLFPLGNGLDWIQSFQSYLDHLSNLRLMERPASDATILYPISLKTDDGFRWRDPEPVMALSILESVALTVITPDAQLKQFNFVEIPLQFILIIEKTQSVLQASQNSSDEHRPWDLTLKLPVNAFTYSLNGRRCRARKIVITFQSREDATECENSIVEWQEDNGYGLLDFPSQMRHDKTAKEDTGAASDVEMHTTPGSQVSIQQATDDIVKDIAVLHNPPGSQTIIEQATDDIIKATAELQNLPGSHGSIQQANKDIFDAIVRLRAAQRSHDSIRLAIHEIVEAIPQLGIIALATEGFMQQGTGDIVEGRVLRQLDGNYSEEGM